MLDSIRYALTSVSGAIQRAFTPVALLSATSNDRAATSYTRSEFSSEAAMSALAGYPWARVGVLSVASDLAGLTLVAKQDGKQIEAGHWMIALLRRPDVGWSGVRWRRQLVADLKSTGDFFARIYAVNGRPYRLKRLHPEKVVAVSDADGDLLGWQFDGKAEIIPTSEMLHIADVTWRAEASSQHLGESPVRCLSISTRAALDARRQAGIAAKRGRVEMMLSFPVTAAVGVAALDKVRQSYKENVENGDGVFITSGGVVATPLSLTPRDTEWQALDLRTRDEWLAVMGVPPVRAQLPSANYGAAKQEMRQYWESSCKALAQLIDAEISYLADPTGSVQICHSFEGIEALQTSYTERLTRVGMWVELGATPYEAAKAEGFDVPPLKSTTQPRGEVKPPAVAADTPQARALVDALPALAPLADAALADGYRAEDLAPMLAGMLAEAVGIEWAHVIAERLAQAAEDAGVSTEDGGCASLEAFSTDHAERLLIEIGAAA
jgi:phage portal protein BeeE